MYAHTLKTDKIFLKLETKLKAFGNRY